MLIKNPTIIFRMINSCNLCCTYCYDKNNHVNHQKEELHFKNNIDNVVQNITTLLSNKNAKSHIIFHGGEPLLISAQIYKKLITKILQNRPNTKFSVQTNVTLLSPEHLEVFKKYDVKIGISLDGYNEEMNKNRIYPSGLNSFNKVLEKIDLLRKENIKFGLIISISKQLLGHEQELYDFIAKNDFRCNIRPIFPTLNDGSAEFIMSNNDYFNFFKRIFDIWINDTNKIKFSQITEIYQEFIKCINPNYNTKTCSCSGNCFENFISLDVNGELYSCNRTYNNPDFYYGNINDISLDDLKQKTKQLSIERQQKILTSKCKDCILFSECKGGCPANSYLQHGTFYSSDDYFCEARIKIRNYIAQKVEELDLINQYKQGLKDKEKNIC